MTISTTDTRSSRSFLRHLAGTALVGIALGVVDAALHADAGAWSDDPLAALRGVINLACAYALLSAALGAALPWRFFVTASVGGFTIGQTVASYLQFHPDAGPAAAAAAAMAGTVVSLATVWLALLVFGRSAPRPRVVDPLLTAAVLVALIVWGLYDPESGKSYAAVGTPTAELVAANRPRGARPNVVLITLDTLRPDHTGPYGYEKVRTPTFDRLASEGAVFERAVVQAPTTPPSHASILTGVTPAKHGVRAFEGGYALSTEYRTLAELLSDNGYSTGAVVASVPLAPGYGIARGFNDYDFDLPARAYAFYGVESSLAARVLKRLQIVRDRSEYRSAEEQTELALRWLAAHRTRSFFLWVHYFDTHDPYGPPRRHLGLHRHPGRSALDILERAYLYDSEVSYVDEQLGRILSYLDQNGLSDNTIVAAISDHGEALGEHGYVGHSRELYQEQLHAAFLMRYPQGIRPGTRVGAQVRSIDLMPTVLELSRLAVPTALEGHSLVPLLDGSPRADRTAFAETQAAGGLRLISVSDGRYKMIANPESGREELYDLSVDPRETENRLAEESEVAERLRREIGRYIAGTTAREDQKLTLEAGARRRLRALGYLD